MLRLIEEISGEDESKLQNNFDAYDVCSGKSRATKICHLNAKKSR